MHIEYGLTYFSSLALYHSLVSHKDALASLRAKQADLQAKLDTLEEILSGLKRSYNPNYQVEYSCYSRWQHAY